MASDKKHSCFWCTIPLVPYSPDDLKKRCGSLQNFAKKTMVHETLLFGRSRSQPRQWYTCWWPQTLCFILKKIMFLYQISILLPVGRTTSTHCMEYEAGHFDKCHNTIEELWVFTNFDPAFQPSYLKDQHMSLNGSSFKLFAAATLIHCLYISFYAYTVHTDFHVIYFQPRRPPNGPETRREEHLPDQQNSQFLFFPPRRSSIRN